MSIPLGTATRTYEVDTTGWAGSGATVSRVTDNPAFGVGCCKVETAGSAAFEAIAASNVADIAVSGAQQRTVSVYIRTTGQVALSLQVQSKSGDVGSGGGFLANHNTNLGFVDTGGEWVRKTATVTTDASATRFGNFRIYTNSQVATTFFVDGWQVDEGATALDYDGDDYEPPAPAVDAIMLMGVGGGTGGPTPFLEPLFAASSPFNTAIGENPDPLVTSLGYDSDDLVAQLVTHGSSKTDLGVVNPGGDWDYAHPIYWAKPGDPLVTVNLSENWDGGNVDGRTIRIPADGSPAPGGDAHLTVIQLENDPDVSEDCRGFSVGLFDVTNWAGGWENGGTIEATSGGRSHAKTGSGTDLGNTTAAGYNNAAGIPLTAELLAGQINHALFIVTNCSDSDAVPPAQPGTTAAVCGTSRYPSLETPIAMPPMGARLQLDPTYDISGFPDGQRAILKALQVYGGFVGDTGMYSKQVMFGLLFESPESGGAALEQFCNQAVSEGWASTDDNDGTPVWYLDFGKNVDWTKIRFVAAPS